MDARNAVRLISQAWHNNQVTARRVSRVQFDRLLSKEMIFRQYAEAIYGCASHKDDALRAVLVRELHDLKEAYRG